MEIHEINFEGQFQNWDAEILKEFKEGNFTQSVGETLIFENEKMKVWGIKLAPNKRLPFHKHTNNYTWTSLTGGQAISHYDSGLVVEVTYEKGDTFYYDHETKGDFVHNLKNIGDDALEFITVEYP